MKDSEVNRLVPALWVQWGFQNLEVVPRNRHHPQPEKAEGRETEKDSQGS